MKNSFITGFLLLIPLAITYWIIKVCFDLLSEPLLTLIIPFFDILGTEWDHPHILNFMARLSSIAILIISIFAIGFVGEHLFEGWLHHAIDSIISRMPFVKTVHKVVKEVLLQFTATTQSPLEKPSIIPYIPNLSYVITSELPNMPKNLKEHLPGYKAYYLPTAPQPLHGVLLFSKEGKHLETNSEEMIKFIISCGVIS
ncbi:MAG: DUF502 domain-containing protein [Chlamydiia bacterium]